MDFGKKVRVGNFEVLKFTRAMQKKELAQSRKTLGIPEELWKHLTRAGVPFIKVSALGGLWGAEFSVCTIMYRFIEDGIDKERLQGLEQVFVMMYADMSIVGDLDYWKEKQEAMNRFIDRKKAAVEQAGNEEEDLAAVKSITDVEEMAAASEEGGSDDAV